MFFERYKKDDALPKTAKPRPIHERLPAPFPSSSALEADDLRTPSRSTPSKTSLPNRPATLDELHSITPFPKQKPEEQPLACLFYFFHSQMSQHTSTAPDPDLVRRRRQQPDVPVHKLDTHLSRLQMHAGFSEHVKSVQAYPVAMDPVTAALHRGRGGRSHRQIQPQPQPEQAFVTGSYDDHGRQTLPSPLTSQNSPNPANSNRNEERDTVLLMQFKSKASREQWMQSREWKEFYQKVNSDDGGIRQMPHVRCARSLRGLMDIGDVLTA